MTATIDPTRVAWRASPAGYGARFDPSYKRPKHVDFIADAFRTAALKAAAGISTNTIVALPPRHSKSETTSHYGPTWLLDMFPSWKVMLGSYEATFASEWGYKVRESLIDNAADVQVRVARGMSARKAWYTTAGGGMFTAGVGGPFTGRGAHCFLIDDPFKNYDDATSKVRQQKVYDWYRSTAYTRLEPNGFVFVIMTRWHEDDLVGKLLKAQADGEGDTWNVLRLPAIAETGDLLGRREGEALWPERFPIERLLQIKRVVGSYLWNAMYQQRPAPLEGSIFKRSWWQWYRVAPALHRFDEIILSWDMSFKDTRSSDYVVGQVWGRIGADKYLLDQVRGQMAFPETVRALEMQAAKWPQATTKLVEDTANGPAVIATLKRKLTGLIPIPAHNSKEARAVAVSPQVEAGNVFLPEASLAPWIGDYVEELATFPNASNDDQVDATSQALHRLEAPRYESESYEDQRLHGRR